MPTPDRRQQLRGALPALQVRGLNLYLRPARHALQGVDLTLQDGVLSLVGRNGMGKTSLCKAIMGLVPVSTRIDQRVHGEELVGRSTTDIARLGIGYVPQGRRLWRSLRSTSICGWRSAGSEATGRRSGSTTPFRGLPSASDNGGVAALRRRAADAGDFAGRCCSIRAC